MSQRLDGLDLARSLALIGMVMVNFRLAMGEDHGPRLLEGFFGLLEGRASATFVILAGIGLGLSARNTPFLRHYGRMARRSLFLAVIGLVNLTVFSADILHFYAVYFLIGAACLALPNRALLGVILIVPVVSVTLLFHLDYGQGWHWQSLTYPDLWTPTGFMRNLLFNGWHPVLPWLDFLLWGILLSRLPLHNIRLQQYMIAGGIAVATAGFSVSMLAAHHLPDYAGLFGTTPLPPLPLYLLTAGGIATTIIGVCLMGTTRLPESLRRWLLPAGRMTLTLYLAHILLGMGTLEALGLLDGEPLSRVVFTAGGFCLLALLFARLWSRYFAHGPLEMVMRRLCG